MPTITLIGCVFVMLGIICIALTPKEKIIQVTAAPQHGTVIAILNATGTIAQSASVPYGEPGQILHWDTDYKMYRWVEAPKW